MFEALRNSGYRYIKFRVFGKPLGYGILRADVCDDTITLSLIIKGNSGESGIVQNGSFTIICLVLRLSRIVRRRPA